MNKQKQSIVAWVRNCLKIPWRGALVLTLTLFILLYIIISDCFKGIDWFDFKFLPSWINGLGSFITGRVIICVSIYLLFLALLKTHVDNKINQIAISLLAAFIGVFIALNINGYYSSKKDSEIYKFILINTQLEIDSNLLSIKEIEKNIYELNKKPINLLTNSLINSSLQNPVFLKYADSVNLILLSQINNRIIICTNELESMLTDKIIYDENVDRYRVDISLLKIMMAKFKQFNAKVTNKVFELPKDELNKLEEAGINIDFNYKY